MVGQLRGREKQRGPGKVGPWLGGKWDGRVNREQWLSQFLVTADAGMFVRSFCLMSSDAKSILGTIYKVSLSRIYWETR